MKYQEAMDYIESIQSYGIVPGLDSITQLCERLGNPQNRLRFVHIAGTNGKGSVLAYISTILKCAGYRVGRYISPVIFEYRERIQVNGRSITKKALCEGVDMIRNICYEMAREGLPHPTPFEVETALGFWYFDQMECDIVVLETGMGGRYDATNVILSPEVAVLTSISMDHMKFLGKSLAEIAGHKAGIIKPGCAVVSACQPQDVMAVVRQTVEELHCALRVADEGSIRKLKRGSGRLIERQSFDYEGADGHVWRQLEISLGGVFQPANALLAVETVCALAERGFAVKEAALRKGLRETVWQGRFSVIARKPLFVADGAHNEDAARKLAQSVEFYFTNRRIIYIMGMLRDKEYEKVIALTHGYADQIITITPPDNPRAMPAYELAQEVAKVHQRVTAVDSLEEAVEMARLLAGADDVILAFGSLSYLGRLIKIVERQTA
ncbi:MAG: bifunctional folylpolyglutamate synthase/dihydrofolate synthase [Butyrivibrio sp.]|nr:bifunctional folylpolyglutamate synthase/dihydrofolate synthase [Muribaculum sp.]MCM1551647.1 bifunctional folylpolyglutamate synthase/dihydrofolate synthase [Butyrivibrio sp.]